MRLSGLSPSIVLAESGQDLQVTAWDRACVHVNVLVCVCERTGVCGVCNSQSSLKTSMCVIGDPLSRSPVPQTVSGTEKLPQIAVRVPGRAAAFPDDLFLF